MCESQAANVRPLPWMDLGSDRPLARTRNPEDKAHQSNSSVLEKDAALRSRARDAASDSWLAGGARRECHHAAAAAFFFLKPDHPWQSASLPAPSRNDDDERRRPRVEDGGAVKGHVARKMDRRRRR
ncbi:hypothetical protein MRX96_013160 [Rhipicephalus microplus]